MPLSKLTEGDLRDACRARLEMLELWLRRLIHEQFEQIYSNDILNAKNAAGDFVVRKQIRETIATRASGGSKAMNFTLSTWPITNRGAATALKCCQWS
jgi:hypothetical protein